MACGVGCDELVCVETEAMGDGADGVVSCADIEEIAWDRHKERGSESVFKGLEGLGSGFEQGKDQVVGHPALS